MSRRDGSWVKLADHLKEQGLDYEEAYGASRDDFYFQDSGEDRVLRTDTTSSQKFWRWYRNKGYLTKEIEDSVPNARGPGRRNKRYEPTIKEKMLLYLLENASEGDYIVPPPSLKMA